jgi:hypothetical protein
MNCVSGSEKRSYRPEDRGEQTIEKERAFRIKRPPQLAASSFVVEVDLISCPFVMDDYYDTAYA